MTNIGGYMNFFSTSQEFKLNTFNSL